MPPKKAKPPLSKTHPKLAKEAYGWDPASITFGMNMKLTWKCKNGHLWEASPNTRSRETGIGCPYCSGRLPIIGINDLKTTHPKIAKKANGWDPKKFSAGSGKRASWKCKNGHEWIGFIYAEVGRNVDCSFCSGKKFVKGSNDLKTSHPKIASEAFGWDPTTLRASSNKKVSWKCKKGHIWKAQISNRTNRNDGCPICSNRVLKIGFNDLKTTHPKLAKQASGWNPEEFMAGQIVKMKWICGNGHSWEAAIANRTKSKTGCPICSGKKVKGGYNDLASKFPKIASQEHGWNPETYTTGSGAKLPWICGEGHIWTESISNRTRHNRTHYGCPFCSNHQVLPGFNDLTTKYPAIAKEAFGWNPNLYTPGSNKKFKWKCSLGHEYQSSIASRVYKKSGCPICTNLKVLPGFNDLQTKFPEIAAQAYGWDPTLVVPGTEKIKSWICSFGHIWRAMVYERTSKGFGCRICSGRELLSGFNDLQSRFPLIASEAFGWDPSKVLSGHGKKKKWKCKEGHIWEAEVAVRTSSNTGCPSCAKYGFSSAEKSWIYLLEQPDWEMLQIGITNYLDQRLESHKRLGWQILETRGPMDGQLARDWETAILRMLSKIDSDLSNTSIAGKFDGYSEAWNKTKFPVKSIKELMRLTEEFEEEKSVTNLSHRRTKKD
jgi:hypothetical protein